MPLAKRSNGNRAGSADPSNTSAVSELISEIITQSASATVDKEVVQSTDPSSSGNAVKPAQAMKAATTDGDAPSAAN